MNTYDCRLQNDMFICLSTGYCVVSTLIRSNSTVAQRGKSRTWSSGELLKHNSHPKVIFCFTGTTCWTEREEWIFCSKGFEKGCGANWWWCGMHHGGKAGLSTGMGKSISYSFILHFSDKGTLQSLICCCCDWQCEICGWLIWREYVCLKSISLHLCVFLHTP